MERADRAALILRLGLAFIWLWESLGTKLLFDPGRSLALLRGTNLFGEFAPLMLNAVCLFELALGVLLLLGLWVRTLAWIQAAVMVGFMLVIARSYPALYTEPTAPIMKNVPIIAAALASGLLGPGRWSLESTMKHRRKETE